MSASSIASRASRSTENFLKCRPSIASSLRKHTASRSPAAAAAIAMQTDDPCLMKWRFEVEGEMQQQEEPLQQQGSLAGKVWPRSVTVRLDVFPWLQRLVALC